MDKRRNICYNKINDIKIQKGFCIMVEKLVKEIDNARVMSKNSDIRAKYEGTLAEAVRFIERNQICEVGLWQKFVEVFKKQEDFANC